jgi:hypothetical protein
MEIKKTGEITLKQKIIPIAGIMGKGIQGNLYRLWNKERIKTRKRRMIGKGEHRKSMKSTLDHQNLVNKAR